MSILEFSFSNAITAGWSKTKQHFWLFVKVLVIAFILYVGSQYWKETLTIAPSWFSTLIGVLIWLIANAVSMGFNRLSLLVFDNQPVSIKNWLTVDLKCYFNYLLAAVIVAVLPIMLGLIFSLLMVPIIWPLVIAGLQPSITSIIIGGLGMILLVWLGIWYYLSFQFATLAVLDQGISAWAGLSYSWQTTKGHKGQLFLLMISLGFINLFGLICLFVGLLMTLPTTWIAKVYAYRFLGKKIVGDIENNSAQLPIKEGVA